MPASSMKQETISLILIGSSLSGKSETANMILGSEKFRAIGRQGAHTHMESVSHDNFEVNIIECSGCLGTASVTLDVLTVTHDIMVETLNICPKGIHAPIFVMKFNANTRVMEAHLEFEIMKRMFEADFIKQHGVCVITGAEEFADCCGDSDQVTFSNWIQRQGGLLGEIFKAFNHRCVLFDVEMSSRNPRMMSRESQVKELLTVVKNEWPQPIAVSVNPDMCARADIHLVVETASTEDAYQSQMEFAARYVTEYDCDESEVEICVTVVGETDHRRYFLKQYDSHKAMAEAVTKTPFLGACQSSQRSLIKAQEVVSSTTRRSDADQLAIVMSGGVAYDVDQAVEEADKLKQLGARVMVIGVRSLNQRFLEMIASDPDDVYIVTDYGEAMTSLTVKIKTKICIIAPAFKSTANVLFVIDSSGSIGTANYAKELDFVVKVTSMFNVAVNAVNFSAITYSNSIIPLFGFDVATHQEIRRATLNAVYQAGGTPTAMALRRAGDILTSYSQVYRRDSKKIAIVITDGASDDPRATCEEAQRLQDIGIFVIAIGVAGAKREELEIIATSVEDVHDVDSFDALVTIKKNIGKNTKELENAVRASRQRVMPEVPTVFSVLSKVWPFK